MIRKLFRNFTTCLGVLFLALAIIPIGVLIVELMTDMKGLTDGIGGIVITTLVFGIPGMVLLRISRRDREREELTKREENEARERLRQRRQDERDHIHSTLMKLAAGTQNTIETLPRMISQAEADLDQAESEFSEGAFAPFWDAVEKAITGLAAYDSGIRAIARDSHSIADALKQLDDPPRIDFPNKAVPEALPTIDRMSRIVRQAQKNFQFATIYEQRRMNGILVAGFANLGKAVEDMGSRIQTSLDELSNSLGSALSSMARANAEHLQELISGMTSMREQLAAESDVRRGHEGNVEEMLDNIQRRRKPLPHKLRDNQY